MILVVLAMGSLAGGALGMSWTSTDRVGGDATAAVGAECTVAGQDVSENFSTACQQFQRANASVYEASMSLNATTVRLSNADSYSNETHSDATEDLNDLRENLSRLDRAQANLTTAAVNDGLTPTQQFMMLDEFRSRHEDAESVASDSVDDYEATVGEVSEGARSTVLTYFGGTVAVGLLVGAVLGAFIPFREARNVNNQLKLSRNVSYNRRAGLVPLAVGVALTLIGLGVLWVLGAGEIIGVIL